jgi:peptide/nickel transport system substrate-binding protein
MMMTMRRMTAGIGLLALVGMLTACPDAERVNRIPGEARVGGATIAIELADIDKPMPLIWESSLDQDFVNLLYLRLLFPIWEDGRIQYLTGEQSPMALARSYEYVPPDSSAIRYRLRTDVLWSDSVPVTAHDVAWSYEAYGDPRVASPRQDYLQHIASITAENDSTVVFQFHRRYPEMLFHTAGGVAPSRATRRRARHESIE